MRKPSSITKEEFVQAWERVSSETPNATYAFVCGASENGKLCPNSAENAWETFRADLDDLWEEYAPPPEWYVGIQTLLGLV
jgi:hypothetical protein